MCCAGGNILVHFSINFFMAKKQITESQQSAEGKAMGSQGNQAGAMPTGAKGTHHERGGKSETKIPNQERSSARNVGKR
jgi:hypothetical protein